MESLLHQCEDGWHEEGKIRKSLGDYSGTQMIGVFLLNWCRGRRQGERAQWVKANTGRTCSAMGQREGQETGQCPCDSGLAEWLGSEVTTRH